MNDYLFVMHCAWCYGTSHVHAYKQIGCVTHADANDLSGFIRDSLLLNNSELRSKLPQINFRTRDAVARIATPGGARGAILRQWRQQTCHLL